MGMLDQHGLNQLYVVNGSMRKVSSLGGCVGTTLSWWEKATQWVCRSYMVEISCML